MRSSDRSESLELARGLPTTAADSDAQRRVARFRPLDFDEYLDFLSQIPTLSPEDLRARRGPRAALPFVLD